MSLEKLENKLKNSKGREFNKIYVDRISACGMSIEYDDTEEFGDFIVDDIKRMMEEENSRVQMEFVYVDVSGKEHEFREETQMDPINVQDMIFDII